MLRPKMADSLPAVTTRSKAKAENRRQKETLFSNAFQNIVRYAASDVLN